VWVGLAEGDVRGVGCCVEGCCFQGLRGGEVNEVFARAH
jgi:hypothetical protein